MSPDSKPGGLKRPHSESSLSSESNAQRPTKKQRVVHTLRHVQNRPKHIEPAPQDPVFAQGQLLKSIVAALRLAGFEAANASAIEMFRSHVEEYMLKFLNHAHSSMNDCRRTTPTALDFTAAMRSMSNAHTASLLEPQLHLALPQEISCPVLSEPAPEPPPAPDFGDLLQPLMTTTPPPWIPSHFPALPPQHAWKQTAVFPEREKDARKMREKATEEGMLAEQALRKLAAAAKTSAAHSETRRSSTLSGLGRARTSAPTRVRARASQDTFADVLKDVDGSDETGEVGMEIVRDDRRDLGMPEGVSVNHEIGHWRRNGARKTARV
ncbi:uncharacterized protein RCC_06899 [Ramularia collo-cygni]|uniref:Transcription initiation factor TFIID subunit 8 n=1 Tax=Ramularia collo-cygni TaxID=112498 RepID=A0A2D3UZU6_9PEZI|nr:uncharacterized protein RCC_06899 [Ramularia collo-cygni]CZT21038.1 uncharacterized protein RCC_06899 [Ramularia collo-cygni]